MNIPGQGIYGTNIIQRKAKVKIWIIKQHRRKINAVRK